jgi:hypothetical protein
MHAPPPSPVPGPEGVGDDLGLRIVPLLEAAHGVWASPQERRRMRTFGFIPAREPGVLKREWHGLQVRVSPELLRAIDPRGMELTWDADARELLLDGAPFRPTPASVGLTDSLLTLISSYERWVEAREGREERLRRGHSVAVGATDRRPLNALAETRRLQRVLHSWRRPTGRR